MWDTFIIISAHGSWLSNSQSFSGNGNLVFVLEIGKKNAVKGVTYF